MDTILKVLRSVLEKNNIIISLIIIFMVSGCGVPFESARMLDAGESEEIGGIFEENSLILGGGVLHDPRYSFDFFGGEVETEEKYHYIIGIENEDIIIQVQFIQNMDGEQDGFNAGIGFR